MFLKPFFLLAFLLALKSASAFTPDNFHNRLGSLRFDDQTHTSITEAGIKRAVRQYFLEKNATAPFWNPVATSASRRPARSFFEMNAKMAKLTDLNIEVSLPDLFHIYYDSRCVLSLTPYQSAVTEIVASNAETDTNELQNRADFHFDGEKFDQSNANIIEKRLTAKQAIGANRLSDARIVFGTALHTLQDFYAHSNWVEMGNDLPNGGLGNDKGFGVPLAGPNTSTCKPCAKRIGACNDNLVVTNQLTSGYFKSAIPPGHPETDANGDTVSKPYSYTKIAKCSHGGLIDASTYKNPIGGINKDTGDENSSPHAKWHQAAANVAVLSTAEFVTAFRHEIGDEQFELFLALKQPQCQNLGRRARSFPEPRSKGPQKITLFSMADTSPIRARVIHDQFSSRHPVVIASAVADFSQHPLLVPVDSTLEDIVVKISAGADSKKEVAATLSLTSPTEVVHTFKINLQNGSVTYVQVQAPELGHWRVRVDGTRDQGPYLVTALGISTWDVIVNVMVLENRGRHVSRPTMRAVKATDVLKSGSTLFVYVMAPVDQANVTQLELRGIDGSLIKNIPLAARATVEDGFSRHLFEVTIPDDKFRFVVRAKDENGNDLTRASETVYEPINQVKANIATDPEATPNGIYIDRNVASSVAVLTAFFVFLWLMAILAVILSKIAFDRCCKSKKGMSDLAGDV